MDFNARTLEISLNTKNQSLLMEKLAVGLGDCLPLIFNCLTSLKDKVRMERVCKTFQKHARSFAAWSNVTSLIFKYENESHLINGENIPVDFLESAIRMIVVRSRNVQIINLRDCQRPLAYSAIARTISEQGVGSYRSVRELIFNDDDYLQMSLSISKLVTIFKSQLHTLKLSCLGYTDSDQMIKLWNEICESTSLKNLLFIQCSRKYEYQREMIKSLLRGKSLEWLCLMIDCIKTDDLIEIVSSLNHRLPLRRLLSSSFYQSLSDLANHLPVIHRKHIHYLKYMFYDTSSFDFYSDWQTILNLPHRFSQLSTLELEFYQPSFSLQHAVEMVVSYLSILNEGNNQCCKYLKLALKAAVLGKAGWDKLCAALVNDHKCKVESKAEANFLVCFDGKELACIELINIGALLS